MDKIANVTDDLIIAWIGVDEAVEQNINARIMKEDMFLQLKQNVEKRNALESLPLIAKVGERLQIISGRHRIRAAKLAGLERIPVLVDMSNLSRSRVVAKQIAHNAINGFDDNDILKQLAEELEGIDDILESFVKNVDMAMITASIKATDFEVDESYREVLFLFLPEVVDNLNEIAERLKPADMVAVAGFEQFNEFVATLKRYSKFANVRNLSIVLSKIIFEMNKQIEEALLPEEEWVSMSSIIGRCGVLPASVAKPLKKRIAAIKKKYNLNKSQGWRVFSILLGEEGEEDGKTNEI